MQHDDDGQPAFMAEFLDQRENAGLMGEVESRRRLVEQQAAGVLGEHHGDPGALAFAAGHAGDETIGKFLELGADDRLLDHVAIR